MAVQVYLSPLATIFQYFNDLGVILAGGKVSTYLAGTSTPQATYTDSTGVTANANPIILGSNGRLPNVSIWQPIGVKIKAIITDANNNQIGPTLDQLPGIDDPTVISNSVFYAGNDTGSANNYVLTIANAGFSSYINGLVLYWIPANNNTGASVVNVNGLGNVAITNADGSALQANQILAGQITVMVSQGGSFVLTSISATTTSFTPTWSGFGGSPPTGIMQIQRLGNQVTAEWTGGQGTSNATGLAITNWPPGFVPVSKGVNLGQFITMVVDNGAAAAGTAIFGGLSTLQFQKGVAPPSATGFTNAGTKGLDTGWSLTYLLK